MLSSVFVGAIVVVACTMAVPLSVAALPRPAVLAVSSLVPAWLASKYVPRVRYYFRLR